MEPISNCIVFLQNLLPAMFKYALIDKTQTYYMERVFWRNGKAGESKLLMNWR